MRACFFKRPPFVLSIFFTVVCFIISCSKNTPYPPVPNGTGNTTGIGTGSDTSKTDPIASFNFPTGLAVDAAGNVYVADYGNDMIRKISISGAVTTLAGNGGQGSVDAIDSLSSFNGPVNVALDAQGNIYVADENNNKIRKINGGMVTTLAGSDSTGYVDGPGATAAFFGPSGICIDSKNNVYVADAGNNLIRIVNTAGTVSTYTGTLTPGADNGTLQQATFNNPAGMTLDATGNNLYLADLLNNLIRKINIPTGMVTTLAGSGDLGSADSLGTSATFYFPTSVAVDASGNVYVAEYVNNRIRKITPDGTVSTFAGTGKQGYADGQGTSAAFSGPTGVAVDASGNVYVADTYNNLIRKITPGGLVSTIAGSGKAGANNGKAFSLRRAIRITPINRNLLHKTISDILVKKRTRH